MSKLQTTSGLTMPSPSTLFHRIAEDAVLLKGYGDHINRRMGPGEYLLKRVSEEDREILKQLKSDDLQDVRPTTILLGCSQDDCKTCRYRFDKNGNRSCTFDQNCIFHDHWREPVNNQKPTRPSVFSFQSRK